MATAIRTFGPAQSGTFAPDPVRDAQIRLIRKKSPKGQGATEIKAFLKGAATLLLGFILGVVTYLVVLQIGGVRSAITPKPSLNASAPLRAVVSPAKEGPCLVDTQYQHGATVIFRIKIFDPATGQALTAKNLSAVSIVLPYSTSVSAQYGTHEGSKDSFWVAKWTIPANFPTGQVVYRVAAQGSNRAVKRVQFGVQDPEAHLTVLNGTATGTHA